MHLTQGNRQGREDGAALVISLLMLAILLLIGSGALTNSRIETQIVSNDAKAKRALFAAEYAMALGEHLVEQARHAHDLGFGQATGRYLHGTRPQWGALTWDDRDSVDITTWFAVPGQPNPQNLPALSSVLQDEHEHPRLLLEEQFFKRDSLTTGQGLPRGVWYMQVAAHGGRARWTAEQRPNVAYDERYPGARVVLHSVYAKRYN